jgi:uncharacterized protein (TIGR02391 family)
MSKLTTIQKSILEKLYKMNNGYVLDFSNEKFNSFFRNDIGVDITSQEYITNGEGKAKRLRVFWDISSNILVKKSIEKLNEYIEHKISAGDFSDLDYPQDLLLEAKNIVENILTNQSNEIVTVEADFKNDMISIFVRKEILDHVKTFLDSRHYSTAVEESYKIVREKLKDLTGKEKANEAFSEANMLSLFDSPRDDAEKDFFQGIKFLHLAIQNLRNEKAHTPARDIDKNLALHYIVLSSLAYDLITRKEEVSI